VKNPLLAGIPEEVKRMTLRDFVREWAETLEDAREYGPVPRNMRDPMLRAMCELLQGAYDQGYQHATNRVPRIEDFCGKPMEEMA
jgi:hypothetical protein